MKARTMAMMLWDASVVDQHLASPTRKGLFRKGVRGWDSHQIRKHDIILESIRNPYQIQRVLVDTDLLRQQRRIVRAQEASSVRIYADAEIPHADLEHGPSYDVGDRGCYTGVDLCRVVGGRVVVVIEVDEEDVGDQR